MTETTTTIEPQAAASIHPADILLQFIVTLLAPMFLTASGGDISFARLAATHTIEAYRARNPADLVAVAQILAFGLAALGSLSMSMADGISMSMTLRLRGNANACNRSAQQNRGALTGDHEATGDHEGASSDPDPDVFLTPSAEAFLAAESQARLQQAETPAPAKPAATAPAPPKPAATAPAATAPAAIAPVATAPTPPAPVRNQDHWATAIAKEASNIAASIPRLPPAERRGAEMRASLLSSTAQNLLNSPTVAPFNANTLVRLFGPNPAVKPSRT